MGQVNKNPLHILGDYAWKDYYTFRDHLRVPLPYLRVVFRKCPNNLSAAVANMHKVFAAVDKHAWEKIMEVAPIKLRRYKVANIPPMYFADREVATIRGGDQPNFQRLVDNLERVTGQTFYFHSEFCDAAIAAAVILVKRAVVDLHIPSYCASFPTVIAEYKTDWDNKSPLQHHVREDALVVLYAVGGEYSTEFTSNLLQEIIRHREAHQKTTIICSSLCPRDYIARYITPPAGIEIGFVDEKIKKTLSQLVKDLGL